MLDADGYKQKKQIGTIATNLAYAVAHYRGDMNKFVRSLMDDIDLNATGNPDLAGPNLVAATRAFAVSRGIADPDAYVKELLKGMDTAPRYDASPRARIARKIRCTSIPSSLKAKICR